MVITNLSNRELLRIANVANFDVDACVWELVRRYPHFDDDNLRELRGYLLEKLFPAYELRMKEAENFVSENRTWLDTIKMVNTRGQPTTAKPSPDDSFQIELMGEICADNFEVVSPEDSFEVESMDEVSADDTKEAPPAKRGVGRPVKEFDRCTPRSKRRKVEVFCQVHPRSLILAAAKRITGEAESKPSVGLDIALSIKQAARLSKRQYSGMRQILKVAHIASLPSYENIRLAVKENSLNDVVTQTRENSPPESVYEL